MDAVTSPVIHTSVIDGVDMQCASDESDYDECPAQTEMTESMKRAESERVAALARPRRGVRGGRRGHRSHS